MHTSGQFLDRDNVEPEKEKATSSISPDQCAEIINIELIVVSAFLFGTNSWFTRERVDFG